MDPTNPPLSNGPAALIVRVPARIRRPHDVPDRGFDHLHGEAHTIARRLDKIAALLEPLHGLAMSDYEHTVVEHVAGADIPETAVLVALLWRARAAAPLPDPTGPTR